MEELNNQFRLTLYSKQVERVKTPSWAEELLEYLKKETQISPKMAMSLWKASPRMVRSRLNQLQMPFTTSLQTVKYYNITQFYN